MFKVHSIYRLVNVNEFALSYDRANVDLARRIEDKPFKVILSKRNEYYDIQLKSGNILEDVNITESEMKFFIEVQRQKMVKSVHIDATITADNYQELIDYLKPIFG